MSGLRHVLRGAGIGRLLYWLWHKPRATVARSRREGGPVQQWRDACGRHAMITAARTLPPGPTPPGASEVHFLTGRHFWYQTAFCAWSLARAAHRPLAPVFVDDGTIDDAFIRESTRVFPGSRVERASELESRLEAHLPREKFPALREQRRRYLHLRKLTDVHAGQHGWRLVLDSDLLFFRQPEALLRWLEQPAAPVHMVDVKDSYGYPAETLRELAGRPLPARLNVGILGLQSETIDWEKIEWWCAQLLARHGTSYYLEQALVALLLADAAALPLPPTDYVVLPSAVECRAPRAAMHHYVDLSKRGYFRHAWRLVWNP